MNKRSSIWAIFIAFSMLFLTIPSSVSAGEFTATISGEATVKNSREQELKRVALLPDKNTRADVYVHGSVPGEYQFVTHKGEPEGSAVSRNEGETGPIYVGNLQSRADAVQYLDKVRYLTIKNNTLDQFGDHKVTLSTYFAGSIALGTSIGFTPEKQQVEVHLKINKLGPISLAFEKGVAALQKIRGPDGNEVRFYESFNYTSSGYSQKHCLFPGNRGLFCLF